MSDSAAGSYFRKGFGLGADVRGELDSDFANAVVDAMRANDDRLTVEDVTIRLAREFGFCYGVERAVEYAYQTRRKFPDRRLLLVGEIIHNPHVNGTLGRMGVEFLVPRPDGRDGEPRFDYAGVSTDDVVILPAFGVTMADFEALRGHGCIVVDTTCGSVLNVWKRVDSYARDGLTALIHGKYYHEETRATASQVLKYGGHYLVVRDMGEGEAVARYVEALGTTAAPADREALMPSTFSSCVAKVKKSAMRGTSMPSNIVVLMLTRNPLALAALIAATAMSKPPSWHTILS
jgi:4-hydroxy-3-methylbut-2-enyl diphosphate reductase